MDQLELKTRSTQRRNASIALAFFISDAIFTFIVWVLYCHTSLPVLLNLLVVLSLPLIAIFAFFLIWIYRNGNIAKVGFKNGLRLISIRLELMKELQDANIFFRRQSLGDKDSGELLVKIPKIKFDFNSNFKNGKIEIENSIKYTDSLQKIDISASLGNFIVDSQYLTSDLNWLVVNVVDSDIEQLEFKKPADFIKYVDSKSDNDSILIDQKNVIPMGHLLLSGKTGSGKSYAIFSVLLQLVVKGADVDIVDLKNSDLTAISNILKINVANDGEQAVNMVKEFVMEMNMRKDELQPKLQKKLGKTATELGFTNKFLIIDEYSALFMSMNREQQKEFTAYVNQVILQGRQLSCFIIIATQQAGANVVPTAIKEQINFNCVLGNSGDQTYNTAFGLGGKSTIPIRQLESGQGWAVRDVAPAPVSVWFPFLNFDLNRTFLAISKIKNRN